MVCVPQFESHATENDAHLANIYFLYIYHNCHLTLNICDYTETFDLLFSIPEHIEIAPTTFSTLNSRI
jgi:hypothetical protein